MTLTSAASSKQQAVSFACDMIRQKPVYLDTETTGLGRDAEIVEIALIDHDGSLLFESLVRPSRPIPPEVIRIHHIHDHMVAQAPTWPVLWPKIRSLIFGRTVGIYNAEYDLRLLQQSYTCYRLTWREQISSFCILQTFSNFRGEWDSVHRCMRRFSLEHAARHFALPQGIAHRARADAEMARAVLHQIAKSAQ